MSRAQRSAREAGRGRTGAPALDGNLMFLARFAGPLMLLARAMLAYIFVADAWTQIGTYSEVADYMRQNGVAPALLPLVIVTQLGGGLLVLLGLATRWAAIALWGYCLLTAIFFHLGADQTVHFQKNIAMAGGFLTLAIFGPGPWSLDAWRGRAS